MKKNKKRIIIVLIIFILFLTAISGIIFFRGINQLFISDKAVLGIDISHHQGNVDFSVMEKNNIQFAFIKATEGSSYSDEMFTRNFKAAENSKLLIGAYHFFSPESSGVNQANHFMTVVGNLNGKLPPVIDVEVYGTTDKDNTKIVKELRDCLDTLEGYYNVKPIIYTTYINYKCYVENYFDDYPLWIRSVYLPARIITDNWTFWQYSDKEKLNGYDGKEKHIDLNIFRGNLKELENMLLN